MVRIKGHEIHENNGNVEVILHLDTAPTALEEFSAELGHDQNANIKKSAIQYVRKNLPDVKYQKIKVMIGGAVIASVLGMALVVPGAAGNQVHAAPTEVGVTTEAQTAEISDLTVGNFTAVVLDGRTQETFADINDFTITDATGSGAGWNVIMSATQFTDPNTQRTLPAGSLSVKAPNLIANEGSGSTPADDIIKTGGLIDDGAGTTILSAGTDEGMGSYTTSFDPDALTLNVPGGAYTGTYTSTVTVTINSGP
ncbi:WxL domain surface cell wall-binding [Oceanobacillus limi]|uniref:WxL domain surface cell wall-binding n=1 Tax=Oceanobacillus limi TaxID=930131 RepID=A0A1I0D5J4_9BACI|nr:WxL domain-containing protein [Oceanobacillus limi]SET27175.1 WxL domain surface cell wall-binding [Oceanobacillus limi]